MLSQNQLNLDNEGDPFFSQAIQYQNEKMSHQTRGSQIFFRSLSMSPKRFTSKETSYKNYEFRHLIPNSSSAETGGFFTTRAKFCEQEEEEQQINNGSRIQSFFINNLTTKSCIVPNTQQPRSPIRNQFNERAQIIDADKGSSSSPTAQNNILYGKNTQENFTQSLKESLKQSIKQENKDYNKESIIRNTKDGTKKNIKQEMIKEGFIGNFKEEFFIKDISSIRNSELNTFKQSNLQNNDCNEDLNSNQMNKIAQYSLDLKKILEQLQENHSIESVHNKIIREMIQKQFRNIQSIPLENYYQSIKEFKEYFSLQLSELQRSIDAIMNSNKQIKSYEDKLKLFTDDTTLDNIYGGNYTNSNHNSINCNSGNQISFNPVAQQSQRQQSQQQNSTLREESINDVIGVSNGVSVQINANLELINKQFQQQIGSLLKQLQIQAEQKDEEITFLQEQYKLVSSDYENQVNNKQEEIDLILQNHKNISTIYTEKIQSLEKQNSHLQNRIEETLQIGLQREQCLQQEVNSLRNAVQILEKSLLLPANENRLILKENSFENSYCLICGSNELFINKQNIKDMTEYPQITKNDIQNSQKKEKITLSSKNLIRQPLIFTQSGLDIPKFSTNYNSEQSDLNGSSTIDVNSAQKPKSRNIFLKNNTTTSTSKTTMIKSNLLEKSQQQKNEQLASTEKFNVKFQEIGEKFEGETTIQKQNFNHNMMEEGQQKNSFVYTFSDMKKEFSELQLTPFNIKIDLLSKYFFKISQSLSSGFVLKNIGQVNERFKAIDKQLLNQFDNLKLIQSQFFDKFNEIAQNVIKKVIEFENTVKGKSKSEKKNHSNQKSYIKEFELENEKKHELSQQEFKNYLSDKISQSKGEIKEDNQQTTQQNLMDSLININEQIQQFINKDCLNQGLQVNDLESIKEDVEKFLQDIKVFQNYNSPQKKINLQNELQFMNSTSPNTSLMLNHLQNSREKSFNLQSKFESKQYMTPQSSHQKNNIFKSNNQTIFTNKLHRESNKAQSEMIEFLNNQVNFIKDEYQQILDKLTNKLAQNEQLQSYLSDFSEFEKLLQQIQSELNACKENDEKRFSLENKANEQLIKENKNIIKQNQEQKQFYENELESAIQNLIIHQKFFDEKKKQYEQCNSQYKDSIQTLSIEISKRNNQQQSNFDCLQDEFLKIHNSINSMIRIEKKMVVSSSKGNSNTIIAIEQLKNEIQNIYTIQCKKLNNLNQIRKKILDKLQRIENHENLLTLHKLKGKQDSIIYSIQNFEKQNVFLENKLSEQKKGYRYLIQVQQEYYNKLLKYLNNNFYPF